MQTSGLYEPVPPSKPRQKAWLTCSDRCCKATSRAHLRAEERRQQETARQQRLARWKVFQPATQDCLEQVEAAGGPELAEQLAEAIRRERDRPVVNEDRLPEGATEVA